MRDNEMETFNGSISTSKRKLLESWKKTKSSAYHQVIIDGQSLKPT